MIQGLGRLLGKSAVVTGAASGIGRATAELFAREGAHLTATDIQGEPLLALNDEVRRGGAEVETVIGDVSIEADARRMIEAAVDRFGRLDVLVANAGIIPLGDALEVPAARWDEVMAVDGRGMFLTCKFAIEAMLPTGGGAIVCLSSISGLAGQKRQAAYGPAKFVATGLTKHLAVEWADRGIRVNAVAPGTIRTERGQAAPGRAGRRGVSRADRAHAPDGPSRRTGRSRRAPSSSSPPTTPPSSPAPCCPSMGDIWRNSACNTYERPREGVRTHPIRLGRSQDRVGGVGVSAFRHGSGTPSAGSARTPRRSGGGDGGEGGLDGVADRHRREYTAVKINPCTTRRRPSSASV